MLELGDTGDRNSTLGDLIKKQKIDVPQPLDEAIKKLWGFASENGRHVKAEKTPSEADARLVVGICACLSAYLLDIKNRQ